MEWIQGISVGPQAGRPDPGHESVDLGISVAVVNHSTTFSPAPLCGPLMSPQHAQNLCQP